MSSRSKETFGHERPKRRLDFDDDTLTDSTQPNAAKSAIKEFTDVKGGKQQQQHPQQSITHWTTSTQTSTPVKKRTKTAIITPGDEGESKERDEFVPGYVHINLDYDTVGKADLPDATIRAFALVCETHTIPSDLQSSRVHGPLSGSSYEEKVLQAYVLNKLFPKEEFIGDVNSTTICVECAEQGHIRDDCPSLL
ncbi:hypothetical protein ACA910_003157 [Epithemia clementina (nom. ined.)]